MTTYSCTVSVQPGAAPEDAKAHHLKNKQGQLVRFQNPFPSYGHWRDETFLRGLYNFLRYVCPVLLASLLRTVVCDCEGCTSGNSPQKPPLDLLLLLLLLFAGVNGVLLDMRADTTHLDFC